jgi:hypothetical protein
VIPTGRSPWSGIVQGGVSAGWALSASTLEVMNVMEVTRLRNTFMRRDSKEIRLARPE